MSERKLGEFADIPIEVYHANAALSASGVNKLLRSPAHYRTDWATPTEAMLIGSAVHALVLEPEKNLVPVAPSVSKRTNAGKAAWSAFIGAQPPGAVVLSAKGREQAVAIAKAVTSNEGVIRGRLLDGHKERSFFADDKGTGAYLRVRPDIWNPDSALVWDLKTCLDASPGAFRKQVANLGYYRAAAMYPDVLQMCGHDGVGFGFICVEKTAPYSVAIYRLCDETIEQGRRDYQRAAELWVKCRKEDSWPGYPLGIDTITLPGWARDLEFGE